MGKRYHINNVILTNHGVYIIDDHRESFDFHDPKDHENAPPPENVLRFNYKSIKGMSHSLRLEQRIVIKVDRELANNDPNWWHIEGELPTKQSRRSRGADRSKASISITPSRIEISDSDDSDSEKTGPPREELIITLVVPNTVDSVTLREIFDEAIL